MDKKYKAVAITVTHKPVDEFDLVNHEIRYVIKDTENGSIVDDAQGYGYKTAQKAYAGWSYKNRDKSKDRERAAKEYVIEKWMKENKSFIKLLDTLAFEKWKDSYGSDKADTKFVIELLKENGYKDLPFTARELLKCWEKGPMYSRRKRKTKTKHKKQK